MQRFGVDLHNLGGVLEVFFDEFGRDANDVLALPVLDQPQRLQRRNDVLRLHHNRSVSKHTSQRMNCDEPPSHRP